MKTKFSTTFTALSCIVAIVASLDARANFANDPTRKESASFTRFFLKRFDKWFAANVGDPRKGLSKKEIAFVGEFLLTTPSLGSRSGESFHRALRYGITVENEKVAAGPFRFTLSDSQSSMRTALFDIAKARGVSIDKTQMSAVVGIGFVDNTDSIELIFKDDTGAMIPESLKKSVSSKPVWVTRRYRGGKVVATEVLEVDLDTHGPCVGSPMFAQVDRVTYDDGLAVESCHTTQFSDQAMAPAARAVMVKIRRGLNLVPGALEVSGKRVRAFYP